MWYKTPEKRWTALRADIEAQDARVKDLPAMRRAMLGQDGAQKNHLYEVASLMLPQIVFQNPRLRIESRVPGDAEEGAIALKWAMESEIARQRVEVTWEQVGIDFLTVMGVTMVTMEANATREYEDEGLYQAVSRKGKGKGKAKKGPIRPERPILVRLSPRDFTFDAQCGTLEQARRMGHCYVETKESLEAQAAAAPEEWYGEVVAGLQGTDDARRRGREADPGMRQEALDAQEIRIWEMWMPGIYLDGAIRGDELGPNESAEESPLYHGTIVTIAVQGEKGAGGVEIRKPRLYRGPASGPYQVYWATPVPDQCERVSLFRATEPLRRRLNKHQEATTHAAENFKEVTVTTSAELQAAINNGKHNEVLLAQDLSVDDLSKALAAIKNGGITTEMLASEERLEGAYAEASGINENKRGQLAAGSTATEAAIANEAGDTRLLGQKMAFHRAASEALDVMAWQMWHSDQVVVPLPLRAARDLDPDGELDLQQGLNYSGGDGLAMAEQGVTWDDLAVDIVPYSMEKTSESWLRQQGMLQMELIKGILEIKQLDPGFPADEFAEDLSSQLNIPGLGQYLAHLGGQAPQGPGPVGGFTPQAQPGAPAPVVGGGGTQGQQTGAELGAAQR